MLHYYRYHCSFLQLYKKLYITDARITADKNRRRVYYTVWWSLNTCTYRYTCIDKSMIAKFNTEFTCLMHLSISPRCHLVATFGSMRSGYKWWLMWDVVCTADYFHAMGALFRSLYAKDFSQSGSNKEIKFNYIEWFKGYYYNIDINVHFDIKFPHPYRTIGRRSLKCSHRRVIFLLIYIKLVLMPSRNLYWDENNRFRWYKKMTIIYIYRWYSKI